MPGVRKFVHDENIRRFRELISRTTDPREIQRLEDLIEKEEALYEAALRSIRDAGTKDSKD